MILIHRLAFDKKYIVLKDEPRFNNQCYNPYIFGKIFSRSFRKCMGCSLLVVALIVLVFLAIISKTVNNRCYNPYIFGKISKRSFRKCMGCSTDCLPISR